MSTAYRIVPAGDSALVVEFEERIDPAVNGKTIACAEAIQAAAIAGVRDVVPTYRSVAVYFDPLRTDTDAVQFVRAFFEAGKPVGAICHGPWTLINADVVDGRTLTSWPSLQADLRNAGAEWVDAEVHVDQGLVSSRKPDDLDAFNEKIVEEFAEGMHEGQRESASAGA